MEDTRLSVLRRALAIIRERGWCTAYPVTGIGPLNIRSALSIACREIAPDDPLVFINSIGVFTRKVGGVSHWEFERTHHEVVQQFTQIISELESDETRVGHRSIGGGSASDCAF